MLYKYTINTEQENFYNITAKVRAALETSGVESGTALVFCPHTTAGITINENADGDVVRDMLLGLNKAFPDRAEFHHAEGNSHAHLKASCIGCFVSLIVENSSLVLGRWQGIYFCEFDGPREREFFVKIIAEK
ncbi:MAG: secondary thiamine-phosphate synthase enzyme YjbQ [Clostridia bacterium]|nr:secondary thiamine-phosphate synthase enzyme YjbQ [Clostridia bacterium]